MDSVKALHSKMLLSDVLQEREHQVAHRERKQAQAAEIEKMWEQTEMANIVAHDEAVAKRF